MKPDPEKDIARLTDQAHATIQLVAALLIMALGAIGFLAALYIFLTATNPA